MFDFIYLPHINNIVLDFIIVVKSEKMVISDFKEITGKNDIL